MNKCKTEVRVLTPPEIVPGTRIVNYFTVAAGAVWGPRIIPDLELILVVAGVFSYEPAQGEAVRLGRGDVLCILPDRVHTFRHCAGHGVISCIHGELLPSASWAAGDYRLDPEPMLVTRATPDAAMPALFRRCAAAFNGYGRYRTALLRVVVQEIWLLLAEHWQTPARGALSKRTARMVDYLRRHLAEPVSRQALARAFALSPQHVNALFHNELGISPTQFVNRERILMAYRLIQNDGFNLKAAAARVGFRDRFYFSRVFKKITGDRPSRIR